MVTSYCFAKQLEEMYRAAYTGELEMRLGTDTGDHRISDIFRSAHNVSFTKQQL